MKNSRIFVFFLFVVLFLLTGCGNLFETGGVKIEAPAANSQFHEPYTQGVSNLITISAGSSFRTDKQARIYIGNVGPFHCGLMANITTTCGQYELTAPGVYVIRIEVDKKNGEVVSDQVSIEWRPYSPLETSMIKISGLVGSKDPGLGFNMVAGLFGLIFAAIALSIGRNSPFIALIIGGMLVFVVVLFAPESVTAILMKGIWGAVGTFIGYLTIKYLADKYSHITYMKTRRPDGAEFTGAYIGNASPDAANLLKQMGQAGTNSMGSLPQTHYDPSRTLGPIVGDSIELPDGRVYRKSRR